MKTSGGKRRVREEGASLVGRERADSPVAVRTENPPSSSICSDVIGAERNLQSTRISRPFTPFSRVA
jgi:hypothetical protein